MTPQHFLEDLQQIFDAAMRKENFSAALKAKELQRKFFETIPKLEELPDEMLQRLLILQGETD